MSILIMTYDFIIHQGLSIDFSLFPHNYRNSDYIVFSWQGFLYVHFGYRYPKLYVAVLYSEKRMKEYVIPIDIFYSVSLQNLYVHRKIVLSVIQLKNL